MPPGDRVAATIPQRLCYRLPVPLTYLAIAVCALAAVPPTPASGGGKTGDARPQLAAYLASHDVPTLAELRGLASAPDKPLMAIAEDVRAEGLIRARAVAALRLLPSPAVQGFLGKLVRTKAKSNDATERLILRRAAVALGWISGPRAAADLALLFDNADPEVRPLLARLLFDKGQLPQAETIVDEVLKLSPQHAEMLWLKAQLVRKAGRSGWENFMRMAAQSPQATAPIWANYAVELHGGYGYIEEYPVQKWYRDAKILELYEGTKEAEIMTIGRALQAR